MRAHLSIKFVLLLLLFVIFAATSFIYGGSEKISGRWSESAFIIREIRLPKTLTAIAAGACLSVAGLILQIMFRNPLAGPYVLGISSGASLMVSLSLLAGNYIYQHTGFYTGKWLIVLSSVSGSIVITLLILFVSSRVVSNAVLLLIGLMLSQICGAIQAALEYFADPGDLKNFVIWSMGSVGNTNTEDLIILLPASTVCLILLITLIKPLNALLLGENYAVNAGINVRQMRIWLILLSSVLTGLITAFCGPVAFVGIAVPILSRMIFKDPRQQVHFFSCVILGSIIMLLADTLASWGIHGITLPVNMITTLIGAPLVIYLMFKNKNW